MDDFTSSFSNSPNHLVFVDLYKTIVVPIVPRIKVLIAIHEVRECIRSKDRMDLLYQVPNMETIPIHGSNTVSQSGGHKLPQVIAVDVLAALIDEELSMVNVSA